jgi:2-keto-4-pentenoate hydratase/2-oxohepta-3-ene-1,7-dioic acid hydratase in catechol pathway
LRIARIELDGAARAAVVEGDAMRVLAPEVSVLDLLGSERERHAGRVAGEVALADARLLSPVQPPTLRDFSVFEQHVEAMTRGNVPAAWYASPFCFFANSQAVNGPGDEIAIPPGCVELDLELELAAVIGRAGKDLSPEQAGAHIAGYTVFNDWSARDLQRAELALGLGFCKAKDFANTFGPWIVTADELEAYRRGDRLDLEMRAAVNGRELGADTAASMAWSFEELVSYASRGTWLRPGDVLGSGTCGYGCLAELWSRGAREEWPPLAPGDSVTVSVAGIGSLTNTIVPGADPIPLPPART